MFGPSGPGVGSGLTGAEAAPTGLHSVRRPTALTLDEATQSRLPYRRVLGSRTFSVYDVVPARTRAAA